MENLLAVLIDDDTDRCENFGAIWESILEEVFPNVELNIFYDLKPKTKERIFRKRPHVIIVDNVFNDTTSGLEKNNTGVAFIQEYHDQYRDSLFILYTGNSFHVDALGIQFPNPDFIVTKTSLLNNEYQEYISKRINQLLTRLPCGSVVFKDNKDHFSHKDRLTHITSILEQCTTVFHTKEFESNEFRIELSTLNGGYSGSHVFKIVIAEAEILNTVPFVFKIGSKSNIEREVDNYNANVRLNMPHDMRVDLIASGETDVYSGVLYSFAFGNTDGISSATQCIHNESSGWVDLIIDSLFLSDTGGWYKCPKESSNILDFYSNSEEYGQSKDVMRLNGARENLGKIFSIENFKLGEEKFKIFDIEFDHIRRLIQNFDNDIVYTTICHGDLNTNNIFFNKSIQSMAMIDFEYSCHDMVFKDFISLETSIRAYSEYESCDFQDLVILELKLLENPSSEKSGHKYLEMVNKIRGASIKLSTQLNLTNLSDNYDYNRLYYTGLLFHLFKLLGLTIWKDNQIVKLTAAYVATAQFLSN